MTKNLFLKQLLGGALENLEFLESKIVVVIYLKDRENLHIADIPV